MSSIPICNQRRPKNGHRVKGLTSVLAKVRVIDALIEVHENRCKALLRPAQPEPPPQEPIRAYVRQEYVADCDEDIGKPAHFLVKTGAPTESAEQKAVQENTERVKEEDDLWEWMKDFVDAQARDLKPWVVQDASKKFAYTHVSIKVSLSSARARSLSLPLPPLLSLSLSLSFCVSRERV